VHLEGICRGQPADCRTEPAEAHSARKLVMETAKFNVIGSHSGPETLESLQKFPDVDAVIAHNEMRDVLAQIFENAKCIDPRKPTIRLLSRVARARKDADHMVSSDQPEELL
jgi:hypothetical protein